MVDLFAPFFVKINGADAPKEFMDAVIEIVVDTSLYLPGMFTILVQDDDLIWVDHSSLELGKQVEISAEPLQTSGGGGTPSVLIKGEITALEPDFSAEGATTLLIRGYDKTHRLHRGKRTRTYLQQTDSNIVTQLAGDVGLSAVVDATSVTHEYLIQNNQTNMEFLMARARRIGYQLWFADGKVHFKRSTATLGDGPELVLGKTLRSFRPRMTAVHQSDKIAVRGWDSNTKQAIVAEAAPNGTQGGLSATGGAAAKSAFGGPATAIVVDRPVATQDEATMFAKALADQMNSDHLTAEGLCFGDPGVAVGKQITIKGVGIRFSGKYFVTAATHVFNARGYQTTFTISGRQPNSLTHLLEPKAGEGRGFIQGVVPALVTNLKDPKNLGRVKVSFPWMADDLESAWARLAMPMAGAERGFYYLPEINDEVLVAFEHGDPNYPYIVGVLWNNKDKPPKPNSEVVGGDGKVNQRILKSRSGHSVILDDTKGAEKIIVRDKTEKNEIIIDSKQNALTIKIEDAISIEAKGAVALKSTTNDVSIECKNLSIKTQQNCSIQATQNCNIQATAACSIKATQNCTVEGTAGVTVKNAAAQVALMGPTVNINNGALEVM